MPNNKDLLQAIQTALTAFGDSRQPLADTARELLNTLGYQSAKTLKITPNTAQGFQALFGKQKQLKDEALLQDWLSVDLLFQVSEAEIQTALKEQGKFAAAKVDGTDIRSYLFFAVELKDEQYTRAQLAGITRQINRLFENIPAMVILKHGGLLSVGIIARRLNKKDGSKDVLEKVTIIKAISFADPHRAHLEILLDLSIDELKNGYTLGNFDDLQKAWEQVLDTSALNKKFFKEVAGWYFWAVDTVKFPKDAETRMSVIRLITRLIFIWFIKEKGLVPYELFDERKLPELLLDDPKKNSYYKAILQNLFFATLNTEMGADRKFRSKNKNANGLDGHHGVTTLYRYEEQFKAPKEALKLFANIPFLNGGLFECLDKSEEKIYIDGFSDTPKNQPVVPDELFFGTERDFDLNEIYDTRNKKYKVRGLINIFNDYKFTIEENTPIEEEIALDPELLGKVFENLLAAYNPETGSTARKQTGSFYTPREIVNYMVDEALIAYLESSLKDMTDFRNLPDIQNRLRYLFAYNNEEPQFNDAEREVLIESINNLKAFDPACGSGAFPMGMLHKLVFVLKKLDHDNARWREFQISKVADFPELVSQVEDAFKSNHDDYGRKLYLIQNCIYGADLQPIAVQITKLRFFISLVVEQKVNESKPNRGIQPLPNLETKFVAANTLIAIVRPQQLMLRNPVIDEKEKQLAEARKRHFSARTPATKAKYREQDKKLRGELADLLKKDGWGSEAAKQLAGWDPYNQNAHADFFDPEWMFDIEGGFDIVIGNPPYLRVQGLQQTQAEYMDYYRKNFESAKGSFDLYALFIERGYQLLDKHGQFAYIVPHKFFQSNFGEPLRRLLTKRHALRQIVRFGSEQVFDEATTYTCLIFLSAQPAAEFDLMEVKTLARGDEVLQSARQRIDHPDYTYMRLLAPIDDGKVLNWDFSVGEHKAVLNRIRQHPRKLGDLVRKIFQGLATSADKIYVLEILKEHKDTVLCYSKHLDEDVEIERGLVKPFLMGKNVHRYAPVTARNVVIFPYTIANGKAELMSQSYIKHNFPLGWKYLRLNQQDLGDRERGRMHGDEFYAYIYPKNLTEFQVNKVMTPDICGKPEMSIDLSGELYHTTTLYSFVFKPELQKNAKFFLGLLNSKVMWYFLSMTGSVLRGGYLRFKTDYLKPFPIAESTSEQEKAIETLVDYVLHLKALSEPKEIKEASDLRVMTAYFEQLIDMLVYEMYFPEELSDAKKRPSRFLTPEQLPPFKNLGNNKTKALQELFEKMYEPRHPVRALAFFLDTLETVRVIEAKSKPS